MAQNLPISLLQRFNVLLLPYVSREAPSELDVIGIAKLARRGSAGSLEDRRDQLDGVLKRLWNKNVDLQGAFDVLFNAKQEKIRAYLDGHRIDTRRDFIEARKKAASGLTDACSFLRDCGYDITALNEFRAAIDRRKWPGDTRRHRAGHQPEPWLKEIRHQLAQLRIPKELREDLLSAVRLTAYGT